MAITCSIGGASKPYVVGSLNLSWSANDRKTVSFAVRSNDGTYRPDLDDEVLIDEDGTRIFGGLIDKPVVNGTLGDRTGAHPAIVTKVSAVGFNAYAERRYVKAIVPSTSLKGVLQVLVPYVSIYGVSLDAEQVDGPTLPDLEFDYKNLTEILNELSTLTGKDGAQPFVWEIDDSKVLRMFQPSVTAAPFDIVDGDGNTIGDITVEHGTRDKYANRVIVKLPQKTEMNHVETFTGDGTTTTFPLTYSVLGHRGYVDGDTSSNLYETLTTTEYEGTATWTYDKDANTITRNSAPADGTPISITFDGTFEGVAIAEDLDEIGPGEVNLKEKLYVAETLPADTTAQAYADGLLARHLAVPKTIHYRTHSSGVKPGQSQTITSALRSLSAESVILQEVRAKDYGRGGMRLERSVTAVSGETTQDSWRDVYKVWAGDKTGGGILKAGAAPTMTSGTGTVVGGAAAPPHRAVQFNRNNSFGGDAAFIYYEGQNSIVCGGGGSSITAADFESCQVFGYNNHIADPS